MKRFVMDRMTASVFGIYDRVDTIEIEDGEVKFYKEVRMDKLRLEHTVTCSTCDRTYGAMDTYPDTRREDSKWHPICINCIKHLGAVEVIRDGERGDVEVI